MSKDTWKYAVIGLAALVVVVSVWMTFFRGEQAPLPPDRGLFVDIHTGQLFDVKQRNRRLSIPLANPDEPSSRTLFPVVGAGRSEGEGEVVIESLYLPNSLEELGIERAEALVDLESGRVRTNGAPPIRLN